ncbi:MAG TPA: ADP-ribosylglycohydrolase family protein [Gemmataceae bacterium]|nr:ADP-ribosylglycohydrolase family protein [Gemmataceae bacterium]
MSFTLDDIRPTFGFDSSCAGTVPPAIVAVLEASALESAVRLAISLGWDYATLASIAGGIAAAYYGVPGDIREQALARLDEALSDVVAAFESRYPEAARQTRPGTVSESTGP